MSWLGRLLRRERYERDLDRELRFHLEAHEADLIRAGFSPDEARRRARIELGGLEQAREETRDARGTGLVEDWLNDTRHALRGMARTPAFTAAAVLTLAVGIGANTAVWSIVDALMLRPLPVREPAELHALRRSGLDDPSYLISHPLMQRLRAALPDSARLAGMSSVNRMYATIGDVPEPVFGQLVSGNWFPLLGVGPAAGRVFSPDDDRTLGSHPVAVLSDAYWLRRFGRAPDVVGRTIRVNGLSLTVAGVAAADFAGLTVGEDIDLWVPLAMQHDIRFKGNASSSDADTEQPWVPQNGISWLTLITRTPPAESAAVQARLEAPFHVALEAEMANRDSASRAYGLREHLELEKLGRGFSDLRQAYKEPLRTLMVSVGLVLLIACANLAGLLLSRSVARSQEMAVRMSLGARSGRLIRQVLTESVTLAVLGGAASLVVARTGAAALLRLASTGPRPVPLGVSLDARVLVFAFAVAVVTGLLFGLAPAVRLARTSLHDAFKAGGRVVNHPHRLPLGRVLVVTQIALSLLLVTSAVLFLRTFQNFLSTETGYERDRVVAARIDVRSAGYRYDQLPALHQRLIEAVEAVPGVRSASLSLNGLAGGARRVSGMTVPGRELAPGTNSAQENFVTPGHFSTVGIELLRGRDFTAADRDSQPRVAIVSETLARHFFDTTDVIGARIGYGTPAEFEIVGLIRDARVNNLKQRPPRLIYYPLAQGPQEYVNNLEARLTGAGLPIDAIRAAIASVDRSLPVREVVTLGTLLERGLVRERLVARIAAVFGVLALLLAGIGLYGVMGYSVSRRTNEMGVRLALGASPGSVAWMVLRDSLVTIGGGLVLGTVLWFPLLGLTRRLVYGLSPHDPGTLVAAAIMLLAVGITAALLPAWRAARIDPARAIRAE